MAGVPGSEFHRWTYPQRRMFTDLMSPTERAHLARQAMNAVALAEDGREVEWYCAEAGYPLPPGFILPEAGEYRRTPINAPTKREIALAAGARPGATVAVQCPRCGAHGSVRWVEAVPRFIGLHIDHILPVSRGGRNDPQNLRLLCPTCNIRRGNREVM